MGEPRRFNPLPLPRTKKFLKRLAAQSVADIATAPPDRGDAVRATAATATSAVARTDGGDAGASTAAAPPPPARSR